jgi:hypothetical protein
MIFINHYILYIKHHPHQELWNIQFPHGKCLNNLKVVEHIGFEPMTSCMPFHIRYYYNRFKTSKL